MFCHVCLRPWGFTPIFYAAPHSGTQVRSNTNRSSAAKNSTPPHHTTHAHATHTQYEVCRVIGDVVGELGVLQQDALHARVRRVARKGGAAHQHVVRQDAQLRGVWGCVGDTSPLSALDERDRGTGGTAYE